MYIVKVALYSNLDFVLETSEDILSVTYVSENWADLETVKIVKKLGFADDLILKARVVYLQKQKYPNVPRFFSKELLFVLDDLETEMERDTASSMALNVQDSDDRQKVIKADKLQVENKQQSLQFTSLHEDRVSTFQTHIAGNNIFHQGRRQQSFLAPRGSYSLKSLMVTQNQPTASRGSESGK